MKNILDKRQLSIKVTANSLYGQTGAKTSTFYEMDVAASTTATGRKLLIYARETIENVYKNMKVDTKFGPMLTDAEYIYGDSVANYTPIYLKDAEGNIDIVSVEMLGKKYGKNEWKTCIEPGKQEKEYIDMTSMGLLTWTDEGWTPLETLIRHKLAPHKNMVRILTHTGCVDVTDDHSLLRQDGIEITPNNCEIGDNLMHRVCENIESSNTITTNEAKIIGFFFGDGSCGIYTYEKDTKSSWALNNQSIELINKYKILCEEVYPHLIWKYYDTIKSSGVYKLQPCSRSYGDKTRFIEKYINMCYDGKCKVIPHMILNGSLEIKEAFIEGVYDADGDKKSGVLRLDQKSQISSAQLAYVIQQLGFNISINTRNDKLDIYRINFTHSKTRYPKESIKKIINIKDYDNYVYDLTTKNHHFAAGVGNMIVHNTDSVFFTFNLKDENGQPVVGQKALEVTIELAKEAGHVATKFLKKPHDLEYENIHAILFAIKKAVRGNAVRRRPK